MKKNHPKIDFYEIPIGNKYFGVFSTLIDNAMRSNVPKEMHARTATYYGKLYDDYKALFEAKDSTSCYIFLLDKNGKIIFKAVGPITNDLMKTLEEKLKKTK